MVWRRLLAFSVLAATLVLPSHSQILNQNLVQNPGAESGPAAQHFTDPQVASIPGWTTTGVFSVGVYGGGDGLSRGDDIPLSHELNFFYAGPGNPGSAAGAATAPSYGPEESGA